MTPSRDTEQKKAGLEVPSLAADVAGSWLALNRNSPGVWSCPPARFRRSLRHPSRRLLASLGLGERSLVLEEGCGGASLALATSVMTGARAVGMDLAPEPLDQSRDNQAALRQEFPAVHLLLVQGDGFTLPFRDGGFDLIVSEGVVEHFEAPDDRIRFFREARRCLKPGGHLLVLIPNNEHPLTRWWQRLGFPWLSEDSPIREYFVGPRALRAELAASGVEVLLTDGENAWSTLARYPNWLPLRALVFVLNRWVPVPHSLRLRWGIEAFALARKNPEG